MRLIRHVPTLCLVALNLALAAQQPVLAPTPPMGWNSWDAYGTTVREDEVRKTIDIMGADLKRFGWEYVVVDIQWSEPNPTAHVYREVPALTIDEYGRLLPAPNRFPSAIAGKGFAPLAAYAHAHGLKFGIHIMRGIPRQAVAANLPILRTKYHARDIANLQSTCAWNTDMYGIDMSRPGAQQYYDSILKLYTAWGVDFIKADDMSRPYHEDEAAGLHRAIVGSGRPVVLSLSPGAAPIDKAKSLRQNAQMWRMADDLWDNWKSVKEMYFLMEKWGPLVEPGAWPDGDMLPLGDIGVKTERGDDRRSRLSHDEQQTLMTMWSIFRSPLMFGGDLLTLDAYTRTLITNQAVIDVDQRSQGNRLAWQEGSLRAWTAVGAKNERYVAMVNLADAPAEMHLRAGQIGLGGGKARWVNLWTGHAQSVAGVPAVTLPAHGSALYRVEQ